ncbi:TetR family transcriptional regulator [Pararhizobium antarcticum]|uniref:TetR family transcriptional regulator n=1 Tax=Pararhizobium antarcticum TaxID=1798805 RepID=A0A657LRR9_9HYPH|nr:TetR family transcriptional regulator [Pararhizobium antarcticum]OJF94971.1 TetR family transcriptional regulator [Pararhizobium antarcticum]OJF97473.1 TetR family transcriptional regulator [Rhizobium sp. 58]
MRRTKAEAEETRHRILDAAERVFYAKGVSNTTLEDVARAAGVSRGAIYWHFANKTDLFLALYNSVKIPQEDMLEPAGAEAGTDALSSIEKAAAEWLDLMEQDEQRQRILSILLRCDYGSDLAPVLERQQEVDAHHTTLLVNAFASAMASGNLDARWTPHSAARALRWMMKGLCSEWLLFGKRFDLATDGREGLRLLFDTFRRSRPH